MSVYRNVHTDFWQRGFILDLTPEEKYFYLYLLTNSKTTQSGIYEIPIKVMELETGYARETIEKLINRFISYGKILYSLETKEMFILNWIEYNPINSVPIKACIQKELKNIKNKAFLDTFIKVLEKNNISKDMWPDILKIRKIEQKETASRGPTGGIDGARMEPIGCMDTAYRVAGEEKEKEKEKEKEEIVVNIDLEYSRREDSGKQKQTDDDHISPEKFFNENFHPITPFEAERLKAYVDDGIQEACIIAVMQEAVKNDARRWNYIDTALKNNLKLNIKTLEQYKAHELERLRKKQENKNYPVQQQKQQYENFEQRDYKVEDLEKYYANVK